MKIIFAGTPDFAATSLAALHQAGHDIALVLTQPDRASGRGMKLTATPVAKLGEGLGLRVEKPATLKSDAAQAMIAGIHAEVMVVAAYGLLLPSAILALPKLGCINTHASLLPRWRGAAPVQRAIEAGDIQTGVGIMQMEAGLDTGPVLLERAIDIAVDETSATLFIKLATLSAEAIVDAVHRLPDLTPQQQPVTGVTYATKISRSEAPLDWSQPASTLERRIRAFDPFPGCETTIGGERLKIWRALVTAGDPNAAVGSVTTVTPVDFSVQCGEQALSISTLQRAGGRRISVRELLQSFEISPGQQCT